MPGMSDEEYCLRVLRLIAEADAYSAVYWRIHGSDRPVTFYLLVADLLEIGEPTMERVPKEAVVSLEDTFADVAAATDGDMTYGAALWICRRRGKRPVANSYPTDQRLWSLFDACGPVRRDADRKTERPRALFPGGGPRHSAATDLDLGDVS